MVSLVQESLIGQRMRDQSEGSLQLQFKPDTPADL